LLPNDENKVCVPQPSSFLLSPDLSRRISFIFDPLALGMLEVDSPPLAPPRRQVSPLGSSCAQLPGVDAVSQSAVLGRRSAPNYLLALCALAHSVTQVVGSVLRFDCSRTVTNTNSRQVWVFGRCPRNTYKHQSKSRARL